MIRTSTKKPDESEGVPAKHLPTNVTLEADKCNLISRETNPKIISAIRLAATSLTPAATNARDHLLPAQKQNERIRFRHFKHNTTQKFKQNIKFMPCLKQQVQQRQREA